MRSLFLIPVLLFTLTNSFSQTTGAKLLITHLTGDFYVYTSYGYFNGIKIPANGMYLLTSKGAVVFDTPWDSTQFQPLLDSIRIKHKKETVLCIATHFHEDRTGGLDYFRNKGIKTYTTQRTDQLSLLHGEKRAAFLIHTDTSFTVGQYSFQTYYPGEGHTRDNIVIWFKKEKVLYGGCLIKSVADKDLGNLSDANVNTYAQTIRNVMQHCPDPLYIITGHNDWTNKRSLQHTLEMAEAARKNVQADQP
ncbi:MAG: BlaB/IND/MUS family subclass B1 metallo-beta-lactamase [Bacteroidetes bacterium]|nr:BlaB/IND/MUS family subclass B1 metallo-beta-lactamase [Bacteroidota bacterium]